MRVRLNPILCAVGDRGRMEKGESAVFGTEPFGSRVESISKKHIRFHDQY